MTSRIRNAYDIRVEEGVLTPDPAQAEVLSPLSGWSAIWPGAACSVARPR